MRPVYVEPFVGAGATFLHLVDPDLDPPVSWMGGKRKFASRFVHLLGLEPRAPVDVILGDACWWGWLWPTLLHAEFGPQVSDWLRRWCSEDPRELWFRLREEGPAEDLAERGAGLLWLQARAASGVPVWWESDGTAVTMSGPGYNTGQRARDERRAALLAAPGDGRQRQLAYDRDGAKLVQDRGWGSTRTPYEATQKGRKTLVSMNGDGNGPYPAWQKGTLVSMDGHGNGPYPAWQTAPNLVAGARGDRPAESYPAGQRGDKAELLQWASTKVDRAGQRQAPEPLLAGRRPCDASDRPADQCNPTATEQAYRPGGMVNPATIADRIDWIRESVSDWLVTCWHADALDLVTEVAPLLRSDGRYYLDPPYEGRTGYPAECPREKVLAIAEECARHGGRVVLSEATGLAEDLGDGWRQVQVRRHDKRPEWITTFNCQLESRHGPLFARRTP